MAVDNQRLSESDNTLLHWIVFIFFRIHYHFNLTKRASSAIFSFIAIILQMISHPMRVLFPHNFLHAANLLQLGIPEKKLYLVCPDEKCNSLYEQDHHSGRCTKQTFGRICGTTLEYEKHLSFGKK